ncbi:MAG: hypothetical protein ABIC91_08720 [Nanoarchaeota archaeon]|nr:hypothetical protein [Nanoarchaeota archaeon]
MDAKGLGVLLIVMGIGSFILPLFGLQFKLLILFGAYQWMVSILMAIIGIVLLIKK